MAVHVNVLVVEDSVQDAELLERELKRNGYDPYLKRVETAQTFRESLLETSWDIVISDYTMPRFSGMDALEILRSTPSCIDIPFILLSGIVGEDTAINAMIRGAQDYVMKDRRARLVPAIERELREAKLRREKNEVEKALRASEERYALFIKNFLGIAYQVESLTFKPFFFHGRVEGITGYTSEDFMNGNVSWKDIIHPDDTARVRLDADLLDTVPDYIAKSVYRVLRKDGGIRWVQDICRSIYDQSWDKKILQGAVYDVTERKEAEEALLASEARYRRITETVTDYIYTVRVEDGEVMAIRHGPGCAFITGYTAEEFYSDPSLWMSIVAPEDRELLRDQVKLLLGRKEAQPVEHRVIKKDGSLRWVRNTPVPKYDTAGKLMEYEGLVQDITDRKEAEESLRSSLREKEVLLREVHHRVKNNLQVISSLLNLQSSYIKDEHALEMFKESINRIRTMAHIHEKLYQSRDYARINFNDYVNELALQLYGSYGLNPELVTIKIVVDDFSVDINTAIPLGLIINELISNAMKHAFPQSRKGEISVAIKSRNGQITLKVSDDGIGFPPHLDFSKTDSLGLQLVNELTEQLDGKIKLERGKGTAIEIVFQGQS